MEIVRELVIQMKNTRLTEPPQRLLSIKPQVKLIPPQIQRLTLKSFSVKK